MDDRESAARELLAAGDFKGAATFLVRTYGPEIYGFLVSHLRDETAAADVFSVFTEDLWRGLPGFEGRSSLRVWAYALAKNAASRHLAAPHRRRARNIPLSQAGELAELADAVRTETLPYLRTDAKSKLAELREQLSPDERALLVLRVDRALDWIDVARILFQQEDPSPMVRREADLKKEAARVRKRFQALKEKVRRLAKGSNLPGG